jgi:Skp family chaperone for outer membrane proteins
MKILQKALAGAVAGLVALSAAQFVPTAAAQAQGQSASRPMVLAVVNLAQVFDRLNEKADNAQELDRLTDQLNKEQSKRKDEIDRLTKNLDLTFKAGSPEYQAAQDDILQKAMQFQAQGQFAQQKLAMEERIRYVRLYTNVVKAVTEYAKATGIVMVFSADDADFTGARTREDVLNRIATRKVIYADPAYDITGKIIEKMNTEYRVGAGAAK